MRKIIPLLVLLILFGMNGAYATTNDNSGFHQMFNLIRRVTFTSSDSTKTSFENGLTVRFTSPISCIIFRNLGNDYWVTFDAELGKPNSFYTLAVEGIGLELTNTSNQILVVRWSQSALGIGSFSGIPFLDGMKYADAGNPSATPDTILAPGQSINMIVRIARTKFDGSWSVVGEPIPKQGGTKFTLTIKLIDDNNNSKYYSIQSPSFGVYFR